MYALNWKNEQIIAECRPLVVILCVENAALKSIQNLGCISYRKSPKEPIFFLEFAEKCLHSIFKNYG